MINYHRIKRYRKMGKSAIMAGFAALPGTSKIGTHSGKISKNGQIGNYGWFCSLAWNQQDRHPFRQDIEKWANRQLWLVLQPCLEPARSAPIPARYRKMGKSAIMAGFAALPGTSKIGTHSGKISKNGQIGNYGWFCSLAWNQQDRHPYPAGTTLACLGHGSCHTGTGVTELLACVLVSDWRP